MYIKKCISKTSIEWKWKVWETSLFACQPWLQLLDFYWNENIVGRWLLARLFVGCALNWKELLIRKSFPLHSLTVSLAHSLSLSLSLTLISFSSHLFVRDWSAQTERLNDDYRLQALTVALFPSLSLWRFVSFCASLDFCSQIQLF